MSNGLFYNIVCLFFLSICLIPFLNKSCSLLLHTAHSTEPSKKLLGFSNLTTITGEKKKLISVVFVSLFFYPMFKLIVAMMVMGILFRIDSFKIGSTARTAPGLWASSPRSGGRGDGNNRPGVGRRRGGGGEAGVENNSIRQSRVARSLRDELTSIICDVDIKASVYPSEELLRSTSIVEVELSPDLSYAKVFISVLGNSVEKRQIFVWLCDNVGQVRYSLAKRLRHMRRVPDLMFKMADSQAAADLIALIEEIVPKTKEDEEKYQEFEEEEEEEE